MKSFFAILLPTYLVFTISVHVTFADHNTHGQYDPYYDYMSFMQNELNYSCKLVQDCASCSGGTVTCTKNNVTIYDAERISDLSLRGIKTTGTDTQERYFGLANSPFVYFKNPPTGMIMLSLNSLLNMYSPKPAFNQKNGWVVLSENGKILVNGNEQDHLFYELSINNLQLNRNGRNFASKEEVAAFLEQSDFLAKLGFTEEEKKNSLDYFLPKLQAAPNKSFYYLTVLDASSIADISTLDINPKPEHVLMKYFALYPTNVAVATTGDFVFPPQVENDAEAYSVSVTGEFLVDPTMVIFWNK